MAGKMRRYEASTSNSGGDDRGETVVEDCGRRKSSCGYCRSPGHTSVSHGLWANSLTVDDYQDLLDRGWRRSGCFLYKPEMERTCCPSYTIRLKASDFAPSKDQFRVHKRMQRFLDGALDMRKSVEGAEDGEASDVNCSCTCHGFSDLGKGNSSCKENEEESFTTYMSEQIDKAVLGNMENGNLPNDIPFPKAYVKKVSQSKRKLLVEGVEELMYSCNIAFQIAAAIRRARSDKDATHRIEGKTPNAIVEELASSLNRDTEASGLVIRACNGHLNFYTGRNQSSSVNNSLLLDGCEKSRKGCKRKGCCLKKSPEKLQGKRRKLEILLKKSSFDPEEFELYKRYQMKVHNDPVSESSYKRFLVDTPLVYVPPTGDCRVPSCGFGSFHQQYIVDGQLVAVGVIDILPKCLSSKYLFWDPDYAFLSLGKYSALQEISWVKENQAHCPSLEYYYLGYYIHSCNKMRYKAAYHPSELLCPLRYQWVPFDTARPLLNGKRYVVLSDAALLQNGDSSITPPAAEDVSRFLHDNKHDGDQNDTLLDNDNFMDGPEMGSSDDESSSESAGWTPDAEDGDVGEILMRIKGSRLRYKDLQRAFALTERGYLESQLHRYKKVVGDKLARRMVYLLG